MATIAIQWATDPAAGFDLIQHNQINGLPLAGSPPSADREPIFHVDGETVIGFSGTQVDHSPPSGSGYIARIVYRGLIFQGDRFGFRRKPGANGYVECAVIRDAAPAIENLGAQTAQTTVWRFYANAQDHHAVPHEVYVDASVLGTFETDPRFAVLDIADWLDPGYEFAHGIWLTDSQWDALVAFQVPPVDDWIGDPA